MKKLLYILAFFLCFAVSVNAATYYIDADAADDTDTGLVDHPWKTIAKVNTVDFADGDIIQFEKSDTFDDASITLAAVTNPATKTITIQAYGAGDLPWIKGAGTQGGIFINNNNQDGLSISLKDLNFDGQHFTADWAAIYLYDLKDITIDNIEADGSVGYVEGEQSRAISIKNPIGDVEIKNCTIEHWGPDTLWDTPQTPSGAVDHEGIFLQGAVTAGKTVSIHDNTIREIEGDGIQLENVRASGGTTIYLNTLWNGGENNLDIKGCSDVKVYNNTIGRDATFTGTSGSSSVPSPDLTQGTLNIMDFKISDVVYGSTNINVHDNIIGPDDRVGISFRRTNGGVLNGINIHHNHFKAFDYTFYTYVAIVDLKVHNNLFDGVKAGGQFIRDEMGASAAVFYNNTFYSGTDMGDMYNGFIYCKVNSSSIFKNNIFMVNEGTYPIIYIATGANPTLTHNNYYNIAGAGIDLINDDGTGYDSTEQAGWRTAGHTGAVFDNPDMTAPATDDFTLTSVSPCIDAGVDLGADFDDGWSPVTSPPPTTVTTLNQNDFGDWEIGTYVSGFGIHTPYPTAIQDCDNDIESVDTVGVTSTAAATCRHSVKGADTCATAYADLDTEFTTTGATLHTFLSTVSCGDSVNFVVKCSETATSTISNCLDWSYAVAGPDGEPPQAGMNIDVGGAVSITTGGTVNIE